MTHPVKPQAKQTHLKLKYSINIKKIKKYE